ncbi:MAG: DUF3037 domain-containing protein [Ginsengibacter sp.]|jgi:hypothetical protein
MQEKHLFEYAVVRVVPRVEREEFLNVGVVLYCAKERFLKFLFKVDESRLSSFCNECDIPEIIDYLNAFSLICEGEKSAGPIAKLPIAERFRWLTAKRSTIVQTSSVHPGLCDNAQEMLERLFDQMVKQ